MKLDSPITEPAFAPVRLPSTPDATLLGNMENLLFRGHNQFSHRRTLFLDRLLLEPGHDCRHGDLWSGVDAAADFLAPLHHGHCPECASGFMRRTFWSNTVGIGWWDHEFHRLHDIQQGKFVGKEQPPMSAVARLTPSKVALIDTRQGCCDPWLYFQQFTAACNKITGN